MITVNKVRNSVISALSNHFPNIKIYGEEIKQGFSEPCFFVKLFPVSQNREVGRRYKRYHTFDIHYFPESELDANDEMQDIAESLYDRMEYVETDNGLMRGHGMKHEIINGVLHFSVDYDFHVLRERRPAIKMQTLEQEGYIK